MNWRNIHLIWRWELRDLFRDRRTVFMIFMLPVVLYPIVGLVGFTLALGSIDQRSTVGIDGLDRLPKWTATSAEFSPLPAAAWLSLTPCPAGPGAGIAQTAGAAALNQAFRVTQDYPPLVIDGRIPASYFSGLHHPDALRVVPLEANDRAALDNEQVDVILVVPPSFLSRLEAGERPALEVFYRDGDERSRLADRRLSHVLSNWQSRLKEVRFLRRGLPLDYDQPVDVQRPQQQGQETFKLLTDEIVNLLGRYFPFLLVMWALAGALHPAIDLTAGEKERSTLETLLLSPASRADIVFGKFLAVWVFSALTALWNLAWLGGAGWLSSFILPFTVLRLASLAWSALLTVFLAALFSAVSMALGAHARSTKEGQYYLMPIFVVTMPLTFLPLVPGVELNWFYSLVPITGVTLLLQRLMSPQPDRWLWLYFLLVVVSLIGYCALALRWAVAQFQREEVLFRDSEGLSLPRWLRRRVGKQ